MPVQTGRLTCLLMALLFSAGCAAAPRKATSLAAEVGTTGVRGQVLDPDGEILPGAYVYAYRSARGGLRGPADFAAAVDPQGHYFLDLVEGTYHLTARWRKTGADEGPPRAGDAWALFPHNPVIVRPGYTARADFVLRTQQRTHIAREGSLASGDTGFRGQLVAGDGTPLAGAFVLAYRNADFRRIPDYTSLPADAGGNFTLYLPTAGSWCLAARTATRGQPRRGEPYGRLGAGEAACRQLAQGEISDVGTIVLTPYHPAAD
ncbi:MAG: hypothetical protein P1P74_06870 [Desulfuromonadales bacterium]|nr:hypothetical protein [Desulfuromonadales bacterium]